MATHENHGAAANAEHGVSGEPDWLRPLRDEFPICAHAAYFQTGTLAPLAKSVKNAVVDALEQEGDAGLCGSIALASLFARAEAAREHLATFLGAAPDQIAWTGNTSLAIRYVLNAIAWQPGDRIVLTDVEHVGTRNAIRALADLAGVEPVVVPVGAHEDEFLASLARLLASSDRARLLFMSHVSCQDGRCLPIEDAIAVAHVAGVPVAIDGAQSVGQLPLDLRATGCDVFIGSGHKWLLGPHGTGYLYARDVTGFAAPFSLVPHDLLQPQPSDYEHRSTMKLRTEIGTESVALKIGVDAAITLLESAKLARARDHVRGLSRVLRDGLSEIPDIHLLADGYSAATSGITSFAIDAVDMSTLRRLTDDLWQRAGVVAKAQLDIEAIRVSVAWFNTIDDVRRLLEALPDALRGVR